MVILALALPNMVLGLPTVLRPARTNLIYRMVRCPISMEVEKKEIMRTVILWPLPGLLPPLPIPLPPTHNLHPISHLINTTKVPTVCKQAEEWDIQRLRLIPPLIALNLPRHSPIKDITVLSLLLPLKRPLILDFLIWQACKGPFLVSMFKIRNFLPTNTFNASNKPPRHLLTMPTPIMLLRIRQTKAVQVRTGQLRPMRHILRTRHRLPQRLICHPILNHIYQRMVMVRRRVEAMEGQRRSMPRPRLPTLLLPLAHTRLTLRRACMPIKVPKLPGTRRLPRNKGRINRAPPLPRLGLLLTPLLLKPLLLMPLPRLHIPLLLINP